MHSTGLAENKLQNEGTINGNVSLEDRTGLTNTGTNNGTVTVEEIVIVDNSGTINKVVGAATDDSPNTITATAGPNGSISPSGAVVVPASEAQTFTITPDTGYDIQGRPGGWRERRRADERYVYVGR